MPHTLHRLANMFRRNRRESREPEQAQERAPAALSDATSSVGVSTVPLSEYRGANARVTLAVVHRAHRPPTAPPATPPRNAQDITDVQSRLRSPLSPPQTPVAALDSSKVVVGADVPKFHAHFAPSLPHPVYFHSPQGSVTRISSAPIVATDSTKLRHPPRPEPAGPVSTVLPLRRPPYHRSGTSSGVGSRADPNDPQSAFSNWSTSHASSSSASDFANDPGPARAQPHLYSARVRAGGIDSSPALLEELPVEVARGTPPRPLSRLARLRKSSSAAQLVLDAESTERARLEFGDHRRVRRRGSVPGLARPLHTQFTSANVESLVSEYGYSDRLAAFIVETLGIRNGHEGATFETGGGVEPL